MFIKINFSFLTVRTSFRSFLVQNVIIVQKRCRMSCIKDKLALFFFYPESWCNRLPYCEDFSEIGWLLTVWHVYKKFKKNVGKPAHGHERVKIGIQLYTQKRTVWQLFLSLLPHKVLPVHRFSKNYYNTKSRKMFYY